MEQAPAGRIPARFKSNEIIKLASVGGIGAHAASPTHGRLQTHSRVTASGNSLGSARDFLRPSHYYSRAFCRKPPFSSTSAEIYSRARCVASDCVTATDWTPAKARRWNGFSVAGQRRVAYDNAPRSRVTDTEESRVKTEQFFLARARRIYLHIDSLSGELMLTLGYQHLCLPRERKREREKTL